MEPEIQAETDILLIPSPTFLFLHNCPSHSDAYFRLISSWSQHLAIHLLPTLNTDCPSQSDVQTSDEDSMDDEAMVQNWQIDFRLDWLTSR